MDFHAGAFVKGNIGATTAIAESIESYQAFNKNGIGNKTGQNSKEIPL